MGIHSGLKTILARVPLDLVLIYVFRFHETHVIFSSSSINTCALYYVAFEIDDPFGNPNDVVFVKNSFFQLHES